MSTEKTTDPTQTPAFRQFLREIASPRWTDHSDLDTHTGATTSWTGLSGLDTRATTTIGKVLEILKDHNKEHPADTIDADGFTTIMAALERGSEFVVTTHPATERIVFAQLGSWDEAEALYWRTVHFWDEVAGNEVTGEEW